MSLERSLSLTAALALLAALPAAQAPAIRADFVFIVDGSGSMGDNINDVADGLSSFIAELQNQNVDARFAVVSFGGQPLLELDFTTDMATVDTTLRHLVGGNGFEAGLEAIRMALGDSPVALRDVFGVPHPLVYRPSAVKNLILLTDEDSDLPYYPENVQPGQTPTGDILLNTPACPLPQGWQAEVDATAQAVIRAGAFINMLVEEAPEGLPPQFNFIPGVECQYGDHDADVSAAGFLDYDAAATLAALESNGFGNSLQAQVLRAGQTAGSTLIGRTFDLALVDDPAFVSSFFDAKIQEVTCAARTTFYGNATPGQNGVPTISFTGAPIMGQRIEAVLRSSTDVDSHGCLLVGPNPTSRPYLGFELLVLPTFERGFLIPGNDGVGIDETRIPWDVPATPESCGMTYYVQAVVIDPATGLAATRGVELRVGM